jgi:hypothetical protein
VTLCAYYLLARALVALEVAADRLTTSARDLEAHPAGRWWEDRTGGQVPSGTSPQPARSGSNVARLSQPRPGGPPC